MLEFLAMHLLLHIQVKEDNIAEVPTETTLTDQDAETILLLLPPPQPATIITTLQQQPLHLFRVHQEVLLGRDPLPTTEEPGEELEVVLLLELLHVLIHLKV